MTAGTSSPAPAGATGRRDRPLDGQEFLSGLRDGREVWLNGHRVDDVTTHPGLRNSARSMARLYDALHEPASANELTVVTDTGSGGRTHPMYRAATSSTDLLRQRDAVAAWARLSYGWLGRTPDYKAGFTSTLLPHCEFYGPFADNARQWYARAQESNLYLNHTLVNLPRDRDPRARAEKRTTVHVVTERDGGIVVRGAKLVATGAALTSHNLVGSFSPVPEERDDQALAFMVPINAPGVRVICRPSFERNAEQIGSPYDYPLSSRFDENDAMLILDDVFVGWEDVLIYRDPRRLADWLDCGHTYNMMLQGATRFAVKLDFVLGLVMRALEATGKHVSRTAQGIVGQLVGWRDVVWALSTAMTADPTPAPNGYVLPNARSSMAFRILSQTLYPEVRETINRLLASTLIVQPSGTADWATPELRRHLDVYYRGSSGIDAVTQHKIVRLLWDATQSEFGGRHDLFETTYFGTHDVVAASQFASAERDGTLAAARRLVDDCLADYDLDGWRAAHLR